MVYSYNGTLLSNTKEGPPDPCKHMHKSQKHSFEQKKPDMKDSMPYDSIYMSF